MVSIAAPRRGPTLHDAHLHVRPSVWIASNPESVGVRWEGETWGSWVDLFCPIALVPFLAPPSLPFHLFLVFPVLFFSSPLVFGLRCRPVPPRRRLG